MKKNKDRWIGKNENENFINNIINFLKFNKELYCKKRIKIMKYGKKIIY